MYGIFIRGRKDPLTCDDVLGRKIKEQWVLGSDALITVDGATFSSRTIYRVEANWKPEPEDARAASTQGEMDRRMDERRREREKYEKRIRSLRALPPQERAQNLDVAKMIWYGSTGEHEIPADVSEAVIERQDYYFRDNPKDAYASPLWYRDLIPVVDAHYKTVVAPMPFHIRGNAMAFVERVIQASFTVR